jgi:hypothetical protein
LKIIDEPIPVEFPNELSSEVIEKITKSFESSIWSYRKQILHELLEEVIVLQAELFNIKED